MIGVSRLTSVYAITNSTSNVNRPLYQQIEDLIENPFFAPDASCMFDEYQLHCIPGDRQVYLEGFGLMRIHSVTRAVQMVTTVRIMMRLVNAIQVQMKKYIERAI